MTDNIPAMAFHWDGESFTPLRPKMADRYYVVGADYQMAPYEERSVRSHRHFFVSVHEAWQNLPEDQADRFATDEHLRKWALIKTGYHDERSIPCSSRAEALRLAAFVRPMDDYAVVVVTEAVVTVYTAKSQKLRAMGKEVFQRSKTDVLDLLSAMVKVETAQLQRETGRAA